MTEKPALSMNIHEISSRLHDVISPNYRWPIVPSGWQMEFIVYPDGVVIMDILHPVSGAWLSDNHQEGILEQPFLKDQNPITINELRRAGIPFMTTFGIASVSCDRAASHLKIVDK